MTEIDAFNNKPRSMSFVTNTADTNDAKQDPYRDKHLVIVNTAVIAVAVTLCLNISATIAVITTVTDLQQQGSAVGIN